MRAFLQKKAGATSFGKSNVTTNIRKHNLEVIFSLKSGWHAVVSITPMAEGAYLIACLGKVADEIDRIVPTLCLKPGEHQMFIDILGNKDGYQLLCMEDENGEMESGFGKILKGKVMQHLQLLGDPEVLQEAEKLCNLCLEVYTDLRKSPYPALKSLTDHFFDQ